MVVKTYRGLLADGGQDKIPLSTKDGSVGYRIITFRLFPNQPGQQTVENTVMIWKTEQASVSTSAAVVNFTDNDLLAAGTFHESHADSLVAVDVVIFDRETFNQDIYVTHTDTVGAIPCNYYLELEQMKLDHTQNMSATLKAIRGSAED